MSAQDAVFEFELEHAGTVRARVSEFAGRRRCDLRLWVEPRDTPGGQLLPTKKGLSVPVEYVEELVEAARALAKAVQAEQQANGARA